MVDDARVTSAQNSRRAVVTLAKRDPQFRELTELLYGSRDPDQVWRATFGKMNPGPSDVHVPGSSGSGGSRATKWALRVGLAGTVAGALASTHELGAGLKGLRSVEGYKAPANRLIPKKVTGLLQRHPRVGSGLRAANAGVALTADAVGTKLIRSKQNEQPVAKIDIPGVGEMASGLRKAGQRVVRDVLPGAIPKAAKAADTTVDAGRVKGQLKGLKPKPAQKPAPNAQAASDALGNTPKIPTTNQQAGTQRVGAAIGSGLQAVAGTPKRAAITLGVGATALGAKAYNAAGNNQSNGQYEQQVYYGKRLDDVEWTGTISKLDVPKGQAFGWASVSKINGKLVGDHQGDVIMPDDMEKAAYDFVLSSRTGGDMHLRTDGLNVYRQEDAKPGDTPVPVGKLIESMVFTPEKIEALGLPDDFPVGWWTGFQYDPDGPTFQDILVGKRRGFSVHGSGLRQPIGKTKHKGEEAIGTGLVLVANRRMIGRGLERVARITPRGANLADDVKTSGRAARDTGRAGRLFVRATRNIPRDLGLSSRPRMGLPATVAHGQAAAERNPVVRGRRVAATAGGTALYVHSNRRS